MSNLTHDYNSGGKWSTSTISQSAQSKTYNFATGGMYVDEDINVTIKASDAVKSSISSSNAVLSDSNTSGVSITGEKVTTAGWSGTTSATKYITGVTIPASKTFTVSDPIISLNSQKWQITTDSSGNVTIIPVTA